MSGLVRHGQDRAWPLPAEEVEAALVFMTEVARRLRLPPYRLVVSDNPTDDGNWAHIDPVEGQCHANVFLAEEWATLNTANQSQTLIHEMLHLTHRTLTDNVRLPLQGEREVMTATQFALFWEPIRLASEHWVDQMTYVLDDAWDGEGLWRTIHARVVREVRREERAEREAEAKAAAAARRKRTKAGRS